MAADGLKMLFVKGGWSNSLFDIQPGECLQQCICFPCCTSPALNEKAGMVVPNKPAAIIVPFLGCGSCLIFMYGKKISTANSLLPKADLIGVFKTWCCGACYVHQMCKEVGGVAGIAAAIGKPSQEEMK